MSGIITMLENEDTSSDSGSDSDETGLKLTLDKQKRSGTHERLDNYVVSDLISKKNQKMVYLGF